ncbi:hypothetical protein H4R34_005733 [Dimargaris verticillata]|uniref:Glycosyl transferase family 25 domain-containing protein n=1 Tax=Dimargaris verticillata TaxID=2761393 RepID=A0A9W8E5W4_9FUNG|nr:hypothetical protein H4R34_005733 [Dimargaris verticillata]
MDGLYEPTHRPRKRRLVLTVLAFFFLVFLVSLLVSSALTRHYFKDCMPQTADIRKQAARTNNTVAPFVAQTTLGFDKIYMVNLDSRTDRLTQILELTSFLHIKVDRWRATDAKDTPDPQGKPSGHRACWDSHRRIYQEVADSPNLKHALILEDDIDIEYDIHKQVAESMKALNSADPDWDMFYIGHCSGIERKKKAVNKEADIYPSFSPACTHGYAVSKSGAKKLVDNLKTFDFPLDMAIISLIESGTLRSYSRGHALFSQFHEIGDWSNINFNGKLGTTGDPLLISAREQLNAFYATMV